MNNGVAATGSSVDERLSLVWAKKPKHQWGDAFFSTINAKPLISIHAERQYVATVMHNYLASLRKAQFTLLFMGIN